MEEPSSVSHRAAMSEPSFGSFPTLTARVYILIQKKRKAEKLPEFYKDKKKDS